MPDSLTLNMKNTESQNNYSGWKEVIVQSPAQNRVNTGLKPGKRCLNQNALSLSEHLNRVYS